MTHSPSTYKRIIEDEAYTAKAISAYVRSNYGNNASYEVRDGKAIVVTDSGTNIMSLKDIQIRAIDLQTALEERPELNKVLQDRQQRQSAPHRSNGHAFTPDVSPEAAMQTQAQSHMKAVADRRVNPTGVKHSEGLPSRGKAQPELGLPSERNS